MNFLLDLQLPLSFQPLFLQEFFCTEVETKTGLKVYLNNG